MNEVEPTLERRIAQVRMLGEVICSAMESELLTMGFAETEALIGKFAAAHFELSRDPFDGQESLKGYWRNPRGQTVGSILFYPDGAFYAEYDVVQPHPCKKQWFVEAMTAWGRGDQVKTEARLLPSLE